MATTKARMSFVQISQTLYNGLESYDANTLYFCPDTNRIYLGTALMSRPAQVVQTLPESGALEDTVYIKTSDKTLYYFNGTNFVQVGGSDETIIRTEISNGNLTTETMGGQVVTKRVGKLFDNITYSNGVLSLTVTTDDDASNSTSSYDLNIPVEQYLSSVARKEVAAADLSGSDASVYAGCVAGDIGILFTMVDGSKMFVKLTDLVDTYTTASGSTDVVKVVVSGYGISATLNFNTDHFETDATTGALKIKASAISSMTAVSGATENNVAVFDANGHPKDSGKAVGGATLSSTPNANTLATEAAVADAVSWTIITA